MASRSGVPIIELLVVFVLVFAAEFVSALGNLVGTLFVLSAPISENPWTVFTSVYAHGSPSHLLSNSVALVLFGWPVARATTPLRFHAFFAVTGAIAGVSQILVRNFLSSFPLLGVGSAPGVLGASGAVFALLGYLIASNRLSARVGRLVRLPGPVLFVLFVVVAGGLTLVTASPGVALIAHFPGLLVGLLAGRARILNPGRPAA